MSTPSSTELTETDKLILSIVNMPSTVRKSITSIEQVYDYIRSSNELSLNFTYIKKNLQLYILRGLIKAGGHCTELGVHLPRKKKYAKHYADMIQEFQNVRTLYISYNPKKEKMSDMDLLMDQFDNAMELKTDEPDILETVYYMPTVQHLFIHSDTYNFSNLKDLVGLVQIRTLMVECPITSFVNILKIPNLEKLHLHTETHENPIPFRADNNTNKREYLHLLQNSHLKEIIIEEFTDVSYVSNLRHIRTLEKVKIITGFHREFQPAIDDLDLAGIVVTIEEFDDDDEAINATDPDEEEERRRKQFPNSYQLSDDEDEQYVERGYDTTDEDDTMNEEYETVGARSRQGGGSSNNRRKL
jgi:hypothetical protein